MILTMKIQNLQPKWFMIGSESKGNYLPNNEVKFLTNSLDSNLCDYSDAYILVTGNITVTGGNANTKVAFKNCALFGKCRTEVNETFVDDAQKWCKNSCTTKISEYFLEIIRNAIK